MSKPIAETEATASSYDVVVVDSSMTLQREQNLPVNKRQSFEATIQLEKFPGAYWTLTTRYYRYPDDDVDVSFLFVIANFPEELQKDCTTEFRVTRNNDVKPQFIKKTPFQSSFECVASYSYNLPKSFTTSLVITKKVPVYSVEVSRKSLLDSISRMKTDEALLDFTFIVKGKRFKVHRLILSASSAVMYRLFTADSNEKETSECEIVDIEPRIFEALIKFMYSCKVPDNLKDIAHELYAAAHYYEVETLKQVCLNEIHKKLSTGNAIKSYALAFKYDLKKLFTDAWKIVKRDILMISNKNAEPMPPTEVEKILEIREKKKAEILKLNAEKKAEISKLDKKIEAENLAFLQKEQDILKNFTKSESDEPKSKKTCLR